VNFSFKTFFQFIIFLAIGVFIMYLMYANQSEAYALECIAKNIPDSECSLIDKLLTDFSQVKLLWIILICLLFMISNVLRALRWNQLLKPIGYSPRIVNSLGAIVIAYFANLGIPRIGEFIRAGTITKYEKIPFEKAMGTIVIGRILDFICLFAAMAIAFLMSFKTFLDYFRENFIYNPWIIGIMIVGTSIILFGGLLWFNKAINSVNSPNAFIIKVQLLWNGFKEGLKSIKKVDNIPLLIGYSIGIWFLYFLMTYLCFYSYVPTENLGPVAGLVTFVFGSLGIVFPAPGGVGSYQFMVSQALVIFGINSVEAFTFSNILFFAIQIFGNVFFGILFLIILPFYNKK